MKKLIIITLLLVSGDIFAQFNGIDIGLGLELPAQNNAFFEVANRPVVITTGGRVNKLALLRINHAIKNAEITHTLSFSEIETLYDVSNPDYSDQYSTRLKSVKIGYSIRVKIFSLSNFFPKSNMELLGGFQGDAYFERNRVTHNIEDEVQENIDVAEAVNNAFQPTVGLDLILQSNPQKRLILSIGFHKQLTSYLGLINYDGNSYKPPKVRLQAYSLFLTYRVFKPKIPKE